MSNHSAPTFPADRRLDSGTTGVHSVRPSRRTQAILCPMWLGCDQAVRAYVEALTAELDRLTARLQRARNHQTASREMARQLSAVRSAIDPTRPDSTGTCIRALHELAMVAEDEGWLDSSEVLVLRKLAFRVGFYLRRRNDVP